MKLNNKGWGLNTLLLCMCAILTALLVAIYYIYKISGEISSFSSTNNNYEQEETRTYNNDYYYEQEDNLKLSTKRYINNNNILIEENQTVILELSELVDKAYMEQIIDQKTSNKCYGYSKISNKNDTLEIKSFINCNNYQTDGYGDF